MKTVQCAAATRNFLVSENINPICLVRRRSVIRAEKTRLWLRIEVRVSNSKALRLN